MQKYGFVYIWYDRKHKRYYIGCHWGYEGDGYICSSSWMKQAYKKRPNDFKPRTLSRVYTDRKDLLKEEYKWLLMIKEEELGKRYYNLYISLGRVGGNANKGRKLSEEHKEKLHGSRRGTHHSEETKRKMSEKAMGNTNGIGSRGSKGMKQSVEAIEKRRETCKRTWAMKTEEERQEHAKKTWALRRAKAGV